MQNRFDMTSHTQHKLQLCTRSVLLEKSNKLSGIDRQRVKDFFTSQSNPTPGESIYKMKLHEEKIAQPDGSVIKETHYLELDYATMGFKKLRKTKKK